MNSTNPRDLEPSPPPTQSPIISPKHPAPQFQAFSPSRPSYSSHRSRLFTTTTHNNPQDEDEIQLVKATTTTTATQDHHQYQRGGHNDYIARVYQQSPTRIASSPRLLQSDSWQDASTEPITPMVDKETSPPPPQQQPSYHHPPKKRTLVKTSSGWPAINSPGLLNTITPTAPTVIDNEAAPNTPVGDLTASARPKLSLSKSKNKRKSEDLVPAGAPQPIAKALKINHQPQEQEKVVVVPEITTTATTSASSSSSTTVPAKRKLAQVETYEHAPTPKRSLLKPKRSVAPPIVKQERQKEPIIPKKMIIDVTSSDEINGKKKEKEIAKKPVAKNPTVETTNDSQTPTTTTTNTNTAMGPPSSTAPVDKKKLTKEEEAAKVHEEIDHLMKTVKCLPNYYKLVDKIGEGTFSTVYKALDIRREFYNNDDWEPPLLNSPTTSASPSPSQSPSQSPTPTSSQDPFNNDSQQPEQASTTRAASPKNRASKTLNQYVALKRIYHTSSPRRIANEILILKKLKGSPCVSPLITAFRQQDQVFVVMPYIQHDDFKATFYHFGMSDIKHYLKSLFTALHHLHKHNILHRDVKPNNFLYSIRKKTGYLIDFGLAEHEKEGLILEAYAAKLEAKTRENIFVKSSKEAAIARSSSSSSSTTSVLVSLTTNKENRSTSSQQQATEEGGSSQQLQQENGSQQGGDQQQQQHQRRIVGQVKNDARHQVRANRAGTRGFRAPEILMRVTRQTCAIDIWAVGVILLCFLSGRYPFFLANDESDSIVELCQIYGYNEMKKCAEKYNRNFDTNLYIPKEKAPYSKLCEFFNKDRVSSWDRKEYLQGIDLLEKCLDLDHKTRITALEALEHPFLNVFDDSQSVTSASNSNNHG